MLGMRKRHRWLKVWLVTTLVLSVTLAGSSVSAAPAQPGLQAPPPPVDPASWVMPDDMTWDDYKPIPGIDWRDESLEPTEIKYVGALVLADFPDQPFVVTLPEGSDPAGNPRGVGNVPREELCDFWFNFLNTPSELNGWRSIHEYWMENSYGQWGVELVCFGPYQLPNPEYRYGLNEWGGTAVCPPGPACNLNVQTHMAQISAADRAAWEAETGRKIDFTFFLHSGYDESTVWQEFGEMLFSGPEAVSDEFGPYVWQDGEKIHTPHPTWGNASPTRYVPWTSWWAAKSLWSRAGGGTSLQAESSGQSVYAHEFSHILGLPDNYNNPYGIPVQRTYTGPWDMMSRGTFNGPGGPHTRFHIPAALGASAGAHHMLYWKRVMDFVPDDQVLFVSRSQLREEGPVFADLWARALPLGPEYGREGLRGIWLQLDGGDLAPRCNPSTDFRCQPSNWNFQRYTVEVVDRMGFDSFVPDHGVLIAKSRDSGSPRVWAIDANPEYLARVDFVRPDGTEALLSPGDYRQLVDALFHAGAGATLHLTEEAPWGTLINAGAGGGAVSELIDEANRLHFYVLDLRRDADGALQYSVAVRHLDGAGPYQRGVALARGSVEPPVAGPVGVFWYEVTNTGEATDLIRVTATTDAGWDVTLLYNVYRVEPGETIQVPVYVTFPGKGAGKAQLTVTVTSETDPAATATDTRSINSNMGPQR